MPAAPGPVLSFAHEPISLAMWLARPLSRTRNNMSALGY